MDIFIDIVTHFPLYALIVIIGLLLLVGLGLTIRRSLRGLFKRLKKYYSFDIDDWTKSRSGYSGNYEYFKEADIGEVLGERLLGPKATRKE